PCRLRDFIEVNSPFEQRLTLGFERTGRTDADALAAKYAGCFRHGLVKKRADTGVKAAPFEVDRVGELRVVGAHLNAAPAQNALGIIADVHRIVIEQRILAS